jgi:hypothetical protein
VTRRTWEKIYEAWMRCEAAPGCPQCAHVLETAPEKAWMSRIYRCRLMLEDGITDCGVHEEMQCNEYEGK